MAGDPRFTRRYKRLAAWVYRAYDVCCICGGPVDKTLRFPDPKSRSLEHLTPIADGGDPYDPANAALAHLGCNSRKGQAMQHRGQRSSLGTPSRSW